MMKVLRAGDKPLTEKEMLTPPPAKVKNCAAAFLSL